MIGEGFTVFEGTRRDSFKVHVLGVLQNVAGPRRNLILARLEGGPLATTGVIAGMSGSPVYIDGRLLERCRSPGLVLSRTDCGDHANLRDDRGHGRLGPRRPVERAAIRSR